MLVVRENDSYLKQIYVFVWRILWGREPEEVRPLIPRQEVVPIGWPYKEIVPYYVREHDQTDEEYARTIRIREELYNIEERPKLCNLWI
jgi:hypothetical protein